MMGELFLYRDVQPEYLEKITFSRMKFWHKFHDYENERIKKENKKNKPKK